MRKIFILILLISSTTTSQIQLPIDFENNQISNEDIIDFNGGSGYVVYSPQIDSENPSENVGVIIRDGGDIWAGSYIELDNYLDFSTNTTLNMRVLSPYPGLMVKFKIEGDQGDFPSEPATERDAYTTTTNQWELLSWDFSGEPSNTYRKLVLMFDFGTIGDGTINSTFYFDDIYQTDPSGGLNQMDLPVTFEDPNVYYVLTDFGGNGPSTILETTDGNYARVEKNSGAETWAGVTIGTGNGFINEIPVTNTDTKMYVHVYVSGTEQTGIPVRLKIEDSNDPTKSVETESFTTQSGEWETMEFDFSNEAEGTAELNANYNFDMASIFFNFGSTGNQNIVYYFDNVSFGSALSTNENILSEYKLYPNPFIDKINIFGIAGNELVVINDILGKEVYRGIGVEKINLSNYVKGTYFLTISKGSRNNTFKIIKK
ncbi:MAG: hypothetical protein CMC69_01685 [Flavobacteriaceae bacterium]|nr:hypothetical protein [Flavobacteriaceae bacterium]